MTWIKWSWYICVIFQIILIRDCTSRIHTLTLEKDVRRFVSVNTFGFFKDGQMNVEVSNLAFNSSVLSVPNNKLGFTLTRTMSDSVTPYVENRPENCLLNVIGDDENISIITFVLDVENHLVRLNCSQQLSYLSISYDPNWKPALSGGNQRHRRSIGLLTSDTYLLVRRRRSDAVQPKAKESGKNEIPSQKAAEPSLKPDQVPNEEKLQKQSEPQDKKSQATSESKLADDKKTGLTKAETKEDKSRCTTQTLPLVVKKTDDIYTVGFQFRVHMQSTLYQGLYSLYFHNCISRQQLVNSYFAINMTMSITEDNMGNYLSAGEIPLPNLFFGLSLAFFAAGCLWIYILRKRKSETFKVHYLMGLLAFVKSFSLLFHGMNYHYIARDGYRIETWAVLYYITHLLKGALLFITIVLIGTGWAFVKHILSDKDKKIFMIVIPLQVLANVAEIVTEESEQGESQHAAWSQVFILVDLLCCGAILFPVVWSIRHLQEASHTDGKAAINLQKLKLFRHFYVMIVCYIYFTRIIVYLLKITVPFQYEWLDEFFRQGATLLFFVFTGYKFQPASNNPYFQLAQEDELEMEEVITQTGITEGLTKTLRSRDITDESAPQRRESSHEYD